MAEAAGASARAIRQASDSTLAEVAKVAKSLGLPWSSGRVGDFESGRISPSLPTLLAVSATLSEIADVPVGLADLFGVDGAIRVNDEITLDAERLRNLLRGEPFQIVLGDTPNTQDFLFSGLDFAKLALPEELRNPFIGVVMQFAEGDERLTRALGTDKLTASAAMAKLWGKTFVQQRDDLAGADANPQKKGIVARQLKSELRAEINGDDQ